MKLRQYQTDAVSSVHSEFKIVQSTLGAAATGAGKTQIYCAVIKDRPGRALVLAHRTELVSQAVERLAKFDIQADIEQGINAASTSLWNRLSVVVATPQTLYANNFARLRRLKIDEFQTVVCDEAHHYVGAPAFSAIPQYFKPNPNVRFLGVTATPDRADNVAMSKLFESVAFKIEITDLIKLGYLVNVDQRLVRIESLDFSQCHERNGELNGAELDRVVEYEKTLLGMADATIKTIGNRRTLVFATSRKQAERFTEIFNRHKDGCAKCVLGNTSEDERKHILQMFGKGDLQICVNVGVLTEGYDNPRIEAVVMARPTLSRSLYAQMAGRGTRPLEGVVESVQVDDPELRCKAIADSGKPSLMLLDFVGNSERLKLVTSADLLGGNEISEEAKTRAKKKIEAKGGGSMVDELKIAEEELKKELEAKRRSGVRATATFSLTYVDPFDVFSKKATFWQKRVQRTPLTENQRRAMIRNKMNPDDYATPQAAIAEYQKRTAATEYQVSLLVARGYPESKARLLRKWEVAKVLDGLPNGHQTKKVPLLINPPKKKVYEEQEFSWDQCTPNKPKP